MKTLQEVMAIEDDDDFAQAVYDGFQAPGNAEFAPEFAGPFYRLVMFPSYVSCDGFSSLFDQIVFPPDWPAYEVLLEKVGANRYRDLLRQARLVYFDGEHLPASGDEWSAFKSVIWSEPEGATSLQFDRIARLAEEAYVTDGVVRKLGSYLRGHWNELYRQR